MSTALGPASPSHQHGFTSRRRQHHHPGVLKSAAANSIMPVKCLILSPKIHVCRWIRDTLGKCVYQSRYHTHIQHRESSCRRPALTGELTYLTPTNPSNTAILTANQILLETQRGVSMTHLMIRLGENPKQKYSRRTRSHSLRNWRIIQARGKPVETLKRIRKNAGNWVSTMASFCFCTRFQTCILVY